MQKEALNQNSKMRTLSLALAAIGAGISIWQTRLFYLTRSGLEGGHSFCNIGQTFDCTAIEMSPYAELMGIPLSAIATFGYLLILSALILGHKTLIRFLTFTALLFSIAYLAIMVGVIGKLCLLCLFVDVINVSLFIFSLKKIPAQEKSVSYGSIAGFFTTSVIVAFLVTQASNPQAELKSEDIRDLVQSVLSTPTQTVNIPAQAPTLGAADQPKVTIIKFSDYQCPACKMGANAIHPLMKRYPTQVQFRFVNFPLDSACNSEIKSKMHEAACEAAAYAICAQEQNQFEVVYTRLFEKQDQLKPGMIDSLLANIQGLNLEQLKACVNQPSTSLRIKEDIEAAKAVKIQSTPTFFINGKKVEGGLPTQIWIQVIDQLLKSS